MDSLKVVLVDGKVRLFIDGEEIIWEKSLPKNSDLEITDLESKKKIESQDDTALGNSAQEEIASDGIAINEINQLDNVPSDNSTQEDLATDSVAINEIDFQENVSSSDSLLENLGSGGLAIDHLEKDDDTSSINTDIQEEIKILPDKTINSDQDGRNKESGIKLNDLIDSNVQVDEIESEKDNFINENVNPDKKENIIDSVNKNLDEKQEKTNDKNVKKDIKPIEIRRKMTNAQKRRKREKKFKLAEEAKLPETKTPNPIEETDTSDLGHKKQPRKYLQSIIKALETKEASLAKQTPLVVKIEKIAELAPISKQDAIELLRTNLNESHIFIEKVVNELGVSKSLEIYDQTRMVQEFGGLDVKNGSRKRTPGGVFISLMREDKSIKPEQIDAILNQGSTNWRKEDAKQRRAKTNAELKEKLEQGGWL